MKTPLIMKFGGTSVEDEAAFARVATIIETNKDRAPVIVVSAMSKLTDALIESFHLASDGAVEEARLKLEPHFARHAVVANALLPSEEAQMIARRLEDAKADIKQILQRAARREALLPALQDEVASYGERLSSMLLTAVLRARGLPAINIDARQCIITD
ncbi:MAG: hypothetical protein IRZ19_13890, partial [Pyrinomonas methylaliphatogenes]|nr:hypothetical protein [Pyrinomonas methylaliphatogenes]